MIEHSISYVKDHLESIVKAGLPVRITRYGTTVGYYNPTKKMNENGTLEAVEPPVNTGFNGNVEVVPSW